MNYEYQTVTLKAITQPEIYTDPDGFGGTKKLSADEFIAYAARVSNPGNQMNTETAPRLIKYLIKNRHWSPFEMVHVVMEIKTTRDIGRQILRHRSFSFQEFSQRYAEVVDSSGPRELRLQDKKNRQNSIELDFTGTDTMTPTMFQEEWEARQRNVAQIAEETYQWALKHNPYGPIAKEQARVVLPEGLTMSTLYMAGTLRSWIHYINERTHIADGVSPTQKEHRDIAEKAKNIILEQFPSLGEYYAENT